MAEPHLIDISHRPDRDAIVRDLVLSCQSVLRTVFLQKRERGGLYLKDRETEQEMTLERRKELWPSVMECVLECCMTVIRRKRFRFYAEGVSLLAAAAFLIAVHTLLGIDVLRQQGTLRVGLPMQARANGTMPTVMVDYYAVLLAQAFDGEFMPEDLESQFYVVFALTGWRGCVGVERRGLDMERLDALRGDAERYRDMLRSGTEWDALRRIEMGGSLRKIRKGGSGKNGSRKSGSGKSGSGKSGSRKNGRNRKSRRVRV